jgi:hypothetical protein
MFKEFEESKIYTKRSFGQLQFAARQTLSFKPFGEIWSELQRRMG